MAKQAEAEKEEKRPAIVTCVRPAGPEHQVVTMKGAKAVYRRQPCSDCPWRKDAAGIFPPEAFRHAANTAYDMATHTFACHQSGTERPAVCAGFLLRGGDHNLKVRMGYIAGTFKKDVSAAGCELHENYRSMAVANGVDPEDPVLVLCRD